MLRWPALFGGFVLVPARCRVITLCDGGGEEEVLGWRRRALNLTLRPRGGLGGRGGIGAVPPLPLLLPLSLLSVLLCFLKLCYFL